MKIEQDKFKKLSCAMKILHNRQLHSSPFHFFIGFLKIKIFSNSLHTDFTYAPPQKDLHGG